MCRYELCAILQTGLLALTAPMQQRHQTFHDRDDYYPVQPIENLS